ncbi:MAG: alpha-galactosidase [Oscillospiraceae bacterium]|nr:alpha-galactosidase [Oscillospiraceae bacterium]
MINFTDNIFRLSTDETSYWFRVTGFGHLEHIYYGVFLPEDQSAQPLILKHTAELGSCVNYDPGDDKYCLDTFCLEWSGIGKGDYRNTPAEIKMPDGTFTADFIYKSHKIENGNIIMDTLPMAYGNEADCKTLEITMLDESNNTTLLLYYTVYAKSNVITRRCVIINNNKAPLTIKKLMSMTMDIPNDGYRLLTFDGGWIKEANKHEREVTYGTHINSSTTGSSSNRHNPGFILAANGTTETQGNAFGFNLVYSGNHYGAVELSNHDLVRIQSGINPYCFEWTLEANEKFETPEAILSCSDKGLNGLSHNFHDFINNHIIRSDWKNKERPVVINNWEAYFFDFNRDKLLSLARRAKLIGVEMFVLDDGWFGKRDNDKAGLGDYHVNTKKLPGGLEDFSAAIHKLGMKFGLWFEPEMVNEDSDLYRAHPEYALKTNGKNPARGRNQLVLDMCNPEVRDYIVENVTSILDSAKVDYVKWDYNRHISDACSPCVPDQGRFFHEYTMGLYETLDRIFSPRPHILFESCSSGGNRFDLGMLCFSPQIWTSDDTDPVERLRIQSGISYLYPLSTVSAHVSEAPHVQTIRDTPIATRFNVAAFGCLGYELDLKYLTSEETKEVKEQIAFYKKNRKIFQFGRFWRGEQFKDNKVVWHVVDEKAKKGISGFFQTQTTASEGFDRMKFMGLKDAQKYSVKTRTQRLFIKRFGGLVKHILPVALDPNGIVLRTANKHYSMNDCVETYTGYGKSLMSGVLLNNQFEGTNYNENTRMLGDYGSNLYILEAVSDTKKAPVKKSKED